VFTATVDDLAVVAPQIATYRRQAHGNLRLSLHRVTMADARRARWDWRSWRAVGHGRPLGALGEIGPALTTQIEPGAALEDNEAVEFLLEPLVGAKGQVFALRIDATDVNNGHAATVWLSDAEERIPGHVACFVGGRLDPGFGIVAEVLGATPVAERAVPAGFLYSPVTQCNMSCIHCISRHTRTSVRRLPDWFKAQLLHWCREGRVTSLACDYSGDILWADARFGGELDYVVSLDVPFQIDTNGAFLTSEVAARLLRSRLFSLNVSLDAATEETYRRVRRGAPPLSEVVANITDLLTVHAAAGAEFPVSISFTLMRSTVDEWPDFIRLAARLGIGLVQTRHLESYTPDMDQESLWFDQARFNDVREEAIRVAGEAGIRLNAPPPFRFRPERRGHRLCGDPWVSAAVFGNGDVAACCVPGMTMGNLHQQSMEEIWNGERYQALRRTVNSPNPPAPCGACTYHRRHDNPGAYLFHRAMVEVRGGAGLRPREEAWRSDSPPTAPVPA
jgi:MoaA/NifB/PqqE/SkfB family radical SAM enzyme